MARNKIVALVMVVVLQYTVSMLILLGIFRLICGALEWTGQIQTMDFTSILPLNYGEVYVLALLLGLVAMLAIAMFCAALNALFQKSSAVLAIGGILTFLPLLLKNFSMLPNGIRKGIRVLSVNAADIRGWIASYFLYPFSKIGFLHPYAILLFSIVIGIASAGIAGIVSKKKMLTD